MYLPEPWSQLIGSTLRAAGRNRVRRISAGRGSEFTARAKEEGELAPEFAADELACELHLAAQAAAGQMDNAEIQDPGR